MDEYSGTDDDDDDLGNIGMSAALAVASPADTIAAESNGDSGGDSSSELCPWIECLFSCLSILLSRTCDSFGREWNTALIEGDCSSPSAENRSEDPIDGVGRN